MKKLAYILILISTICQAQKLTKGIDYETDTLGGYTVCTFNYPVILSDISSSGGPFQNFVTVKSSTSMLFDNGKMFFKKESGLNTMDRIVNISLLVLYETPFIIYGIPAPIDTMSIRKRGSDLCSESISFSRSIEITQNNSYITISEPLDIRLYDIKGQLIKSEYHIQYLTIDNPGFYILETDHKTNKIIVQ